MIERLSKNEQLIMEYFWKNNYLFSEDISRMLAEKEWKPTTILTFLSRLVSKGMLRIEKKGKTNIYHTVISKDEYQLSESRKFIDSLFEGSTKDFISAMIDSKDLSKEDLQELRKWLDSKEEKND